MFYSRNLPRIVRSIVPKRTAVSSVLASATSFAAWKRVNLPIPRSTSAPPRSSSWTLGKARCEFDLFIHLFSLMIGPRCDIVKNYDHCHFQTRFSADYVRGDLRRSRNWHQPPSSKELFGQGHFLSRGSSPRSRSKMVVISSPFGCLLGVNLIIVWGGRGGW